MHIKVRRSRNNRVISGVLGGIAKKYNWNTNLLRAIWVILTLSPFPGLIVYLVLWLLMDED